MPRHTQKSRLFKRFSKDREGVAAILFALLAPIFFALVFGIIELLLFMASSMWLEAGTQLIQERMEADRREGNAFNIVEYRDAVCDQVPGVTFLTAGCTNGRLRIAAWYSGRQPTFTTRYNDVPAFPLTEDVYITPGIDTTWGDVWTIGLQIDWPFVLPTTRLLTASPGLADLEQGQPPIMATVRNAVVPRILVARP